MSASAAGLDLEAANLKRLCRRFSIAATTAMVAIGAVIAVTLVALIEHSGAMKAQALLRLGLTWSPTLFYLWALWALRRLFGDLAREGPAFRPAVTLALGRIGWALMLGAASTAGFAPIVLSLTHPHTMGGFATFDVPALTLCVVGLALIVIAGMLRRAAALETEAAALQATLEEFI